MSYTERLPINRISAEAVKNVENVRNAALALLSKQEYTKYRELLNREIKELDKFLVEYKNPDPIEYAFVMQGRIAISYALKWLAGKVEPDGGVNNEVH